MTVRNRVCCTIDGMGYLSIPNDPSVTKLVAALDPRLVYEDMWGKPQWFTCHSDVLRDIQGDVGPLIEHLRGFTTPQVLISEAQDLSFAREVLRGEHGVWMVRLHELCFKGPAYERGPKVEFVLSPRMPLLAEFGYDGKDAFPKMREFASRVLDEHIKAGGFAFCCEDLVQWRPGWRPPYTGIKVLPPNGFLRPVREWCMV